MTGKNITYKEMMQYMIAENVHKELEDMLREAGYEIGDGAGQVLVESVSGMVREMVISTDRLEKGDKRTMSKEHPDGYYYRIPCAILARTNPGRRCYEDTYLQVVFVAGQVKTWGQKITMIWAGSDGAKMLGPDEGDIMWSESVFDRHEYHLDGKFDPFRGKDMTAGINDPEEEEVGAEETVETAERAETEEADYSSEYWKRISRRLREITADDSVTETETAEQAETEAEQSETEETAEQEEQKGVYNSEYRQKIIQAYGVQEADDDDLAFGFAWLLPEEFEDAAKEAAGKYVAEMLQKAYEYTTAVGWGSSRNVADDGDAERYNLVYVSIQGEPEVVGADVMPDAFKWRTTYPEQKMYKVLVEIRHHYDVQAKTLAVYIAADRTGTMRHSIWDVKTGKLMFWSPVWAQEYGENTPKVMPVFTAFRWREEHFEYKNYQDLFVHMDITLARKLGLLDDPEENEIDIWA